MPNPIIKFCLAILLLAVSAPGPARAEDPALAKLFADRGLEGTVVISSLRTGQSFVHNDARANRRLPVASTFKIINTLIALQERAIAGKDDTLHWDGQIHDFPDWNRDQTLASAFKVSCVWCYQELARRIGADVYRRYLQQTEYGELREPFALTEFWLDGSLQISAAEQVEFLRKLVRRSLPFDEFAYDTLRDIMLAEQTPAYALRAKTGWAARANLQVGWYVGYVETQAEVWLFALNIDVRGKDDLALRQKLAREALAVKGIFG
ncbi:class D beta-lactamase [Methylomonas koyamae]|uniref:beta-lactamase n=2 Tax=Methylomonas koyamae TaxID=702114 RepID=A0AA91I7X9_9GAMM|nr:class D beta-lactamase [Methylomonas koyamae]OAI29859.1 class D beta-lactamase [Methylomonas koyamae]